jgi:hypothetical protein
MLKAVQHLIGGVLEAGVGLVQLTGCLASQLAQLVAIGDMRESSKNQIRTHCNSPSKKLAPAGTNPLAGGAAGAPTHMRLAPNFQSQSLDAQNERTVQNPDALSQIVEQALCRISDTGSSLGNYPSCIPIPAVKSAPGHQRRALAQYDAGKVRRAFNQTL